MCTRYCLLYHFYAVEFCKKKKRPDVWSGDNFIAKILLATVVFLSRFSSH